ncbi:LytR C-terminal domain-containing protein [Phaeacidiphilus oryzae]|uniref:LytR C-terminal domain-containing protein n=1 Tax=Phaeacidiphilus oryzae TaxID=348818 RepID=UPI002AFEB8F8|nr:LytR C-terminal domain-containing protein [Phaeacidiphilus oryzae]
MLTPPGMQGKQYRITGNAYPRLHRPNKRRKLLAVVAAVVVAGVLGWGTVQLIGVFGGKPTANAAVGCAGNGRAAARAATASAADAASASASAAPQAGLPAPSAITVNVLNSTNRPGLAAQTAAQLKQRGFKIGKIGNAPAALENKVTGSAQVIGGPSSDQVATVVGTEVPGAKATTDSRTDAAVDLVIGTGFKALATPQQASAALAAAAHPHPAASASPSHC